VSKSENREEFLRVRVNSKERQTIESGADRHDLPVSTWARRLLLRIARQEALSDVTE
jgi:hypothetical protein